jgi:hypothetical protein
VPERLIEQIGIGLPDQRSRQHHPPCFTPGQFVGTSVQESSDSEQFRRIADLSIHVGDRQALRSRPMTLLKLQADPDVPPDVAVRVQGRPLGHERDPAIVRRQ